MIIVTNAEINALETFVQRIETDTEYKKQIQGEHPGADFEQYAITFRKLQTIKHQQHMSNPKDYDKPEFYSLESYTKRLGATTDYSELKQQISDAKDSIRSFLDRPLSDMRVSDLVAAAPVLLESFLEQYTIVPKRGTY